MKKHFRCTYIYTETKRKEEVGKESGFVLALPQGLQGLSF